MMDDGSTGGWTRLQVLVIALCVLVNALDGMDVMIISYVAPALAQDWGVGFATLGVVFSGGLGGMMVGCLVIAPLADVVGRRPVVIGALAVMTIGAVASGLVETVPQLVAARVVTGLGIGTLLASIAALASEYAPPGRRSLAIGLFQAGYPLGAVLTGLLSLWAIPALGWQGTLIAAGVVSALTLPVIAWLLPESVAFLEARQPAGALARSNALRASMGWAPLTALPPRAPRGAGAGLGGLFAGGMWRPTLLLWVATLLGFAVLYFVTSWIPRLATAAGFSQSAALWAGSMFNLGGMVGGVAIGWLAIGRGIAGLIALFLTTCAALLMVFAQGLPLGILLVVVAGIGLTLQGGFSGFYSLAAGLYPAAVRGTGVGWAVGVGRGGSVLGPLAGGLLLEADLPLWQVFGCFAAPLVIAGLLAMATARAQRTIQGGA